MSTVTMANAMLEDDFKSSHPDLMAMMQNDLSSSSYHQRAADKPVRAQLPTRKSVEFAILPPTPKRTRMTLNSNVAVSWTAKQVVDAISTSVTKEERLEAVQKAKDSFQHDVQSLHDEEMATGADAALTKHFVFLVYLLHNRFAPAATTATPLDEKESQQLRQEIGLTCDALESLFRASSHIVGASFRRMGSELMHVLITVLNDELRQRRQSAAGGSSGPKEDETKNQSDSGDESLNPGVTTTNSASSDSRPITPPLTSPTFYSNTLMRTEGDLVLRKATKILGHFARVGEATRPMANSPGLLGTLVHLISLQPYECVPWEARLSALWTIANLACNADNMQMMACLPNLLAALIAVACRPLNDSAGIENTMEVLRSRSIASRAILNLSWSPENKILLAENSALVDLLGELTVQRAAPMHRSSRTVQDILVATRRHAAGALRNLAAAPRRVKIGLCEYRNGHLLDVLTDAALNDPDCAVKDRAFATIHNLATHDTAIKIVNHPALILALKDVLLSSNFEGNDDHDQHVEGTPKQHASATLMVLERSITPDMDSYDNLRDLLEAVNPSNGSNGDEDEITNEAAV